MEIRRINGHDNYFVSDCGNVYSTKGHGARELKQTFGSRCVIVKMDGRTYSVARLVAETFIPNSIPDRQTIAFHLDGNITNNTVGNLVWVTPSEMRSLTKVEIWDRRVYLHGMRNDIPDDEELYYSDAADYGEEFDDTEPE